MTNPAESLSALSFEQVVAEFKEIVASKGSDYVYLNSDAVACMYFEPEMVWKYEDDDPHNCGEEAPNPNAGQPSCIVGHWFARHGVTPEELEDANEAPVAGALRTRLRVFPDNRTLTFLETVQSKQDSGSTWGDALSAALEQVDLLPVVL